MPIRAPESNFGSDIRVDLDDAYGTELPELEEDERLSQPRVRGNEADMTPGRDRGLEVTGGDFLGDDVGMGYSAGKGPEILGLEECVRRLCIVVT